MSKFQNDAIFWVDVDKIDPNPYQPRRDFNEEGLRDLAESIRQYGVLQPLTVTRNEKTKEDGGLKVYYELIAGERRLKAAKLANLSQVPVTIRDEREDAEVKLELAIIENLQREDLNPIERAEAFNQLAEEFDFTHKEIAGKIGKSREYVSNSMRLLKLPEEVKKAVMAGKISEGHTRPILMLRDKPEQQEQLFKEIIHKDLTVRESEKIARREAQDKVRKKENKVDPETKALEDELSETFGTRVTIEKKDEGGQLKIDFFSKEDLEAIVEMVKSNQSVEMEDMMEKYINEKGKEGGGEKKEKGGGRKQEGVDENQDQKPNKDVEIPADDNKPQVESSNHEPTKDVSRKEKASGKPKDIQHNDQSKGDGMAETLGTLIQQAKKEKAHNNSASESDQPTKQKQAAKSSHTADQETKTDSKPASETQTKQAVSKSKSSETSSNQQNGSQYNQNSRSKPAKASAGAGSRQESPDGRNQDQRTDRETDSTLEQNNKSNADNQKNPTTDPFEGVEKIAAKASKDKTDPASESSGKEARDSHGSRDQKKANSESDRHDKTNKKDNQKPGLDDSKADTSKSTENSSEKQHEKASGQPQQDDEENTKQHQNGNENEDEDDMYSVSNFSI